tara:strand:+ start:676 stop:1674 length:999 start_codon:yes stop_codon:yes gene_type:complete
MKIAFFSEGSYVGTPPRDSKNMRTDTAWVCALNAVHYPIPSLLQETITIQEKYDIGIVIIPKTTGGNTGAEKNPYDREALSTNNYALVENLKSVCDKVLVMQESTHWDWQEDDAKIMTWYYLQLASADGILCHNDIDVPYFEGITGKPAYIFPTLMIEDTLKVSDEKEDKVFVAGNWHTTYRGFDAWVMGVQFGLPMTGFKSGKFKEGEGGQAVNYLPWMYWTDFMYELSKHKYGIQCYQASAGQFPLNCAYFGIPCVGYNDVNTQRDLFPELSVDRGDIVSAKKIINELKSSSELYERVSINAKNKYIELYSETAFLENWKIIEEKLNGTK